MNGNKTKWQLPEAIREIEADGNRSIVLELIDSFQSDTVSRLERLHNAVARLDIDTVKAEAHAVLGSARQMGAEALADLCQAVEAGAPEMNWPELAYQVKQVEARFAEVCSAMSEFVKARRRAG